MQDIALRRRQEVAERTFAFYFDKPAGFSHQAGQNALFSLPSGTENRTFTLASAPHERELMIATRMRDSPFKRTLAELPVGGRLKIDGPAGLMVLHEDESRPAVFLAGGIGITPFLAMARDAAHRRLAHRLFLFYGNRRPEDAAFLDELSNIRNPNWRLIAAMSEAEKSARPWSGERGFIDQAMLQRHLGDLRGPVYYFAGPPAMAMAMQQMLAQAGVSDDDMRSEEFYGY